VCLLCSCLCRGPWLVTSYFSFFLDSYRAKETYCLTWLERIAPGAETPVAITVGPYTWPRPPAVAKSSVICLKGNIYRENTHKECLSRQNITTSVEYSSNHSAICLPEVSNKILTVMCKELICHCAAFHFFFCLHNFTGSPWFGIYTQVFVDFVLVLFCIILLLLCCNRAFTATDG
jgi:hypothetical protein